MPVNMASNPATLSPAETSQLCNITNLEGVDPEIALVRVKLQSSLQHDPDNRRNQRSLQITRKMVFCKLQVGPDRPQLPENWCRESFGDCLPASVRHPPRLANIKGKPTKRIVRTLTTESSGGNRLTYEKELLNSRKNSHF